MTHIQIIRQFENKRHNNFKLHKHAVILFNQNKTKKEEEEKEADREEEGEEEGEGKEKE